MRTYNVRGVDIHLIDNCGGPEEIFNDNYKIFDKGLSFKPDDIIIDIGANVGFFSIMMAKIFPQVKVFAFEPMSLNINKLRQNIALNNLTNIAYLDCAITNTTGMVRILYDDIDLGGSSSYVVNNGVRNETMAISYTLDDIFEMFQIQKCRLLKIDCEGAEYEILYNTKVLPQIDTVVGEFHMNDILREKGYDWNKLAEYVGKYSNMMFYEWCYMAQ